MTDRMANLHDLLRVAMKVELATIPVYLQASFSLEDREPGGSATNAEAKELIRSVLVEEMLHLTLVANILNAVGGEARLDQARWVPDYPAPLFPPEAVGLTVAGQRIASARPLKLHLKRFRKSQVRTFLQIEGPAQGAVDHPDGVRLRSIGEFYAALKAEFVEMADEIGEETLFSGACAHPERQVPSEYYYAAAGHLETIGPDKPLETTLRIIKKISEEGEGVEEDRTVFDGDEIPGGLGEEPAHYFRFKQILEGRKYAAGQRSDEHPSGPPIAVDWDAVWPSVTNPRAEDMPDGVADLMGAFDRAYSDLLRQINQAYRGEPHLLVDAVHGMFRLKDMGVGLMRIPLDERRTAGPAWRFVEAG